MTAHRGKFVAYYRVSTNKQGKSGLGLEAQPEAVNVRLNGGPWQLVGIYGDRELQASAASAARSGAKGCKKNKAKLVVVPAASTLMRTSSGPGSGRVGCSANSRTSGPPNREIRMCCQGMG
jgi:DNA invertase Pin-like site-specific DNA recombinase